MHGKNFYTCIYSVTTMATAVLISVHKTKSAAKKAADKKRASLRKSDRGKYRITVKKGSIGYSVLAHKLK